MPSFSVTITTNTTPAVSVTSTNVTYGEIKRSLGDFVYFVKRIYMYSTLSQQIGGVVKYQHYNVNGNVSVENLTPALDPYQFQASLFYHTKEYDIILDGQSNFKFNLLPSVYLKLEFYASRKAKRDALDIIHPNNFKTLESAMGDFNFFEDWQDEI